MKVKINKELKVHSYSISDVMVEDEQVRIEFKVVLEDGQEIYVSDFYDYDNSTVRSMIIDEVEYQLNGV